MGRAYHTIRQNNDVVIYVLTGQVWIEAVRITLTDREWGVVMHAPEANILAVLKKRGVTVPRIELLNAGPSVEARLAALGGPVSPTYEELEIQIFGA